MNALDWLVSNPSLAAFVYSLDEVHVLAFLLGAILCSSHLSLIFLFLAIIGKWLFLLRYRQLLDD